MDGLRIINMTNFFSRELYLYSLGDLRLPQPISLKTAMYFILGAVVWSVPILLIFGIIFNVFYLLLVLAGPVALAVLSSRPIFGGRGLIDALVVTVKYLLSPRLYTDGTASSIDSDPNREVSHEFWISRRRELHELAATTRKKKARRKQ